MSTSHRSCDCWHECVDVKSMLSIVSCNWAYVTVIPFNSPVALIVSHSLHISWLVSCWIWLHFTHFGKVNVELAFKHHSFYSFTLMVRICGDSLSRCCSFNQGNACLSLKWERCPSLTIPSVKTGALHGRGHTAKAPQTAFVLSDGL